MLKCNKCGAALGARDAFCGVCGTTVIRDKPSASKSCLQCHNPVLPEDTFCGVCGSPIPATPTALVAPMNICLKCKTPAMPGDTFCGVCGAKIEDAASSGVGTILVSPSPPAPIPSKPVQPVQPPRSSTPLPIQPVMNPPPAQPPRRPVPPPTAFSYGQEKSAQADGKKKSGIVIGIVVALAVVVVLIVGGIAGFLWYQNHSFGNRVEKALAADQLFSPPGECVADLVAEEKSKDLNSKKIVEYAGKIKNKIVPSADKALDKWYKESDQSINWDDLEKQYGFLISILPDDKDIAAKYYYVSAQIAIKGNSFEKARDLYQKALEQKPDWALPLNGLGKVYIRDDSPFKDSSMAVTYYQKAIEADSKFTWAYVNLSTYYRQKGDLEAAKANMRKALDNCTNKSSLFIAMGNICTAMDNYYEADWYFKKALEYETDDSKKEKIRKAISALNQQ